MGPYAHGADDMMPGDEYAEPGLIWSGKTVFCLASGDSLRRLTESEWHGIIAKQWTGSIVLSINSSIKTARAAGCEPNAILFSDLNWYEDNEALIKAFPGPRFTFSRRAKVAFPDLWRIDNTTRPDFAVGAGPIKDGRSSGNRAISVAVKLGARRVILLGYDMRIDPVSGRSHCHNDYHNTEAAKVYAQEFIPSFNGWDAAARDAGVEIWNATDGTALDEFAKVGLNEVLTWRP